MGATASAAPRPAPGPGLGPLRRAEAEAAAPGPRSAARRARIGGATGGLPAGGGSLPDPALAPWPRPPPAARRRRPACVRLARRGTAVARLSAWMHADLPWRGPCASLPEAGLRPWQKMLRQED